MPLSPTAKILVTGAHGFLGSHILNELTNRGYTNVFAPTEKEIDLLNPKQCETALQGVAAVIHAAGKLGGTVENKENPADFFYSNAMLGVHLLHAARNKNLKKFVQIGTVISYPKEVASYPVAEDDLWNGYPDETKEGYAMAKKFHLVMGTTYRKQYHVPAIHLLLANMYGPNDHFRSAHAHVVPALIDRFWEAKQQSNDEVVVWGSGKATRDFLYVGDAARAIVNALEHYDDPAPVNIASGTEVSIKQLAETIAKHIDYPGHITWDTTKPDGLLRNSYDISRAATQFDFRAHIDLDTGLKQTITWYQAHIAQPTPA